MMGNDETELVRMINIIIEGNQKHVSEQDCDLFGELRGQAGHSEPKTYTFHWSGLAKQTVTLLARLLRNAAAHGVVGDEGLFNSGTVQDIGDVLGSHLYELLFGDETGELLQDALNCYEAGELRLVRVALEFAGEDANALTALPWEYVRLPPGRGEGYLVRKSEFVLNRRLHLPRHPTWQALGTGEAVKILVIAASPALPEGDSETPLALVSASPVLQTIQALKSKLGESVEIFTLQDPAPPGDMLDEHYEPRVTRRSVCDKIDKVKPHVVHFIGHGRRGAERGQLALSGEDSRPDWIDDDDFADLVCANHYLRLVILQACESALPSRYVAGASGVASQIAARGIPAVVAMQYSIDAAAANIFATAFYAAVLGDDALPVDVAVSKARREMIIGSRGTRASVSNPVVYLLDYHRLMGGPKIPQTTPVIGPVPHPVIVPQASGGCPRCGKPVSEDDVRCGNCGLLLLCPQCGHRWNPLAKWCNKCPPSMSTRVRQPSWPPERESADVEVAEFASSSFSSTGQEVAP